MKRYLTTPIYYASGVPHLGHAYTTFVADCYKRFYRLQGDDVMLVTGTDEHGQKIERAAAACDLPVETFVSEHSEAFRHLWDQLDIDFDRFERTTSGAHKNVAREFWRRLTKTGDVYRGQYEGLYCVDCEQYFTVADYTSKEDCPVHKRPLEWFSEPSWFFRLSRYQARLIDYIESHPAFVRPAERRNEVLSLLRNKALNDLSISRSSTKWGVPIPGDDEHVMYVWVDALVTYLSALGDLDSQAVREYWPRTIHFIGKDILIFHSVYWPALLMSAGLPLPESIIVNGWLTVEGGKISKSDPSTIIDPLTLTEDIGNDGLKWYFLKVVSLGQDVDFNRDHLVELLNADLANNIGNLVSRFIALVQKYFPEGFEFRGEPLTAQDKALLDNIASNSAITDLAMANGEVARAARSFVSGATLINTYIQEMEPWRSDNTHRLKTVLWVIYQSLGDLTVTGWSFLPGMMARVREGLCLDKEPCRAEIGTYRKRVAISPVGSVFPRIATSPKGSTLGPA